MSSIGPITQILGFLATVALVIAALAATVTFALLGRRQLAQTSGAVATGLVGAYLAVLLTIGAAREDRILGAGTPKVFCEIDCHIAFEIVDVRRDSGVETGAMEVMVTVRERFDAESVSSRRGNGVMRPGARNFALVDHGGRRYPPVSIAMTDSQPLFAPMRPGETHEAELRFVLPVGVSVRGLLVEDDAVLSRFLVGHERSPLHGKTLLAVYRPGSTAVVMP